MARLADAARRSVSKWPTPYFSFQARDYRQLQAEAGRSAREHPKYAYGTSGDGAEPDAVQAIKQVYRRAFAGGHLAECDRRMAGLQPILYQQSVQGAVRDQLYRFLNRMPDRKGEEADGPIRSSA